MEEPTQAFGPSGTFADPTGKYALEGVFTEFSKRNSGGPIYPRATMDELLVAERHKLQDRKRAEIIDRFLGDSPNPFLLDNMERLRDEFVDAIVAKREGASTFSATYPHNTKHD